MLQPKVLLASFVFLVQTLAAQPVLEVQGTSPNLYLVHTVVAKDNWYSVGRLYNQNPKALAPYNGVALNKPLLIGEAIKIPLNTANFSQNSTLAKDEVFVPVYHVVQEKEWMYRIGQNNNKVPVAVLEKWNNIKNEQLKPGMRLVVGYLKVKTGQSALAAQGSKKIVPVAPVLVAKIDPPTEEKSGDLRKDPVLGHEVKKDESNKEKPEDSKIVAIKEDNTQKHEEQKAPSKAETALPKEEPKLIHPVTETGITSGTTVASFGNYKGGFFKPLYAESGKDAMGNAGVFKSTSGWKDGKYYALMNNVPVGTVIKVTFSSTNKSVFAKVLGQLPEMKESTGLMMRLSDAAASELGVENGKFYVDVKY